MGTPLAVQSPSSARAATAAVTSSVTPALTSSAAIAGRAPAAPEVPACAVCLGHHASDACPLWQQPRPFLPPARRPLQLAFNDVVTRNVPADGNCLFHALGIEIADALPLAVLPAGARVDGRGPNPTYPGAAWRRAVLRHVQGSTNPSMDGHTPGEWLLMTGWTMERYLRRMTTSLSKRSWGGQLEAAFVADILREYNLRIIILKQASVGRGRGSRQGVGEQGHESGERGGVI